MPTIEHSALTSGELHEPKGADAASEGMVYVADGAGSGTWTFSPLGWGTYQDNAGNQIITTTETLLSNNGGGASTIETQLPYPIRGSSSLWDTVGNKITPVAAFDVYNVRLDLPVTAESGSPTELRIELDISGSGTYAGATIIVDRFANTGRVVPYIISLSYPVYSGTTFLANGGQFWLSTDAGSVTITNPTISLFRVYGALT